MQVYRYNIRTSSSVRGRLLRRLGQVPTKNIENEPATDAPSYLGHQAKGEIEGEPPGHRGIGVCCVRRLWIGQDCPGAAHSSPAFGICIRGFHFPAEVITVALRWYLRCGLSYREVEELLAERGVEVDHVTVYRWVQQFTPLLEDAARFTRHAPGDRSFVDETYVKVIGQNAAEARDGWL